MTHMAQLSLATLIEVRGFKWPRRPTATALAYLLGQDTFGHWLGVRSGDPWWAADRSRSGVFGTSFVKLVPTQTFWTACFNAEGHVVDVDIVLPAVWRAGVLEEVDLELDILRSISGEVSVRDQDAFDQVRQDWGMPDHIAAQAEATCAQIYALVAHNAEPFGTVGHQWLARFLAAASDPLAS